MKIKANCKINLGLFVVRKREDGYHDLETVMLPVRELYDVVEVERREDYDVTFVGRGVTVDCPVEDNLTVRAARLVMARYATRGVSITLDKRVPFGAGLGGGSSDATAVIVAMNELYGLGLGVEQLVELASAIGSDTAYFVHNDYRLCTGRGEITEPINLSLKGLWLAVVKPEEGVSTAEAYRGVEPRIPQRSLRELLAEPVERWQGSVVNDFEPHIFLAHPRIAELKAMLLASGAVYASMSGSGSALFGLFSERPELPCVDGCMVHVEEL